MKKVLFATTALVASAGIASAEVAVTGSAEMGIVGGTGMETQFFQDIDVTFTMSGETDNGLSFGAAVDLDEAQDDCKVTALVAATAAAQCVNHALDDTSEDGGVAIFISGDFGTLTMGDTDGAFDWAMTEVALAGGSINDAETTHAGYNGNSGGDGTYDGQIVRYDHSVGDFSFAVSVEADEAGTAGNDPIFGIGFKYNADLGGTTLGVGLGYQAGSTAAAGDMSIVGLSLNATMDNGISVGLNYSDAEVGGVSGSHIGIGFGYTMDALAIGVNWGQYDTAGTTTDGFGLAATYDLGGGASIKFGYGTGGSPSVDSWSLGVAMSF